MMIFAENIEQVTYCKYLCTLIDTDLKWQEHINYIYNIFKKYSWIFYKIRTKIPRGTPNDLFRLCPLSDFIKNYGIEVYANTFSTYVTKLSVLNNKLLRILHHKSHKTTNIELYKTYWTLPVYLLHNLQILIFLCISICLSQRSVTLCLFLIFWRKHLVHHNTGQKHQFHISSV